MISTESLYNIYKQHPVVTTDSRKCPQGSMFFALRGENFDGNRYALSALENGCAMAVVDNAEYAVDERFLLVDDVLTALQRLAAYHRLQWGGKVLQITGTNGKTTTKELVAAVLMRAHNLHYTQGNLNNHIGVPLTLLGIRPEHDMAVVETGANHPGEIEMLSRLVQADCGLITNVGRAHLEGFGSFDGVKSTKGELYDNLISRRKPIFLNAMDDDLREMAETRGFRMWDTAIPYVEGRVEECNPLLKIRWRADVDEPWQTLQTQLIGTYNIANVRAAVTVGLHFGVSVEDINKAIEEYVPTNNRSEFRDTGRNRLVVDAYNANPSSMAAALTNFSFLEFPHKMVILGDMRELGADSEQEHRKVLELLRQNEVETVWLVGEQFAALGHEFRTFRNVEEVMEVLREEPVSERTILIKGSNGTGLFRLPELL